MEVLDIKAASRIEELIQYRNILETKEDVDLLNQVLNRLEDYKISYDDLYNTKIGKSLKKLTKNKDKNIAKRANKLIEKWKKVVENKKADKEREVSEDNPSKNISNASNVSSKDKNNSLNSSLNMSAIKTNELSKAFIELNKKMMEYLNNSSQPSTRNSVRKTIYEALVSKEEMEHKILIKIKDLAIDVEATIHEYLFKNEERGKNYYSRVKAIASNLQDKNNPDFRTLVISGNYSPKEITLMDVKKMASKELQSKRLTAEKDSFNSIRSDWHEVHAPVGIGMHKCEKCGGLRTTSKEIQLRGADEPMTLFLRCVECGNEWRIG